MRETLITGVTGQLGRGVLEALQARNVTDSLAVLTRHPEGDTTEGFREQQLDVRIADYADRAALEKAFAGIAVLYFVSSSDIEHRLPQHENVVAAARAAGVEHILYTSSVRKTEGPETVLHPVIEAHRQTEEWIRESGLTYTILRHNLYADLLPFFMGAPEQLLNTDTVYLPAGAGRVALVPRDDLAEAAATILADPAPYRNRILEFNGSENVTFGELTEQLSGVLGRELDYVSPSREEFRETLRGHGVPDGAIWMTDVFATGIADGEFSGSTTDLEKVLGRRSRPLRSLLHEVYG
ncbi:NmrA family NAD(P)-binding protein [Lewinella sp. IMCC34183]|uniref:NAD(P)H-binding protein n=1 Tax=Lewinella sp. IMCC34183 TaxID=2248762 RepID=UPI000E22ED07|nr:NmrA family NAD(P)-binding protein [Lewinella sp. IMCC34183]